MNKVWLGVIAMLLLFRVIAMELSQDEQDLLQLVSSGWASSVRYLIERGGSIPKASGLTSLRYAQQHNIKEIAALLEEEAVMRGPVNLEIEAICFRG
jgi:hypothetical protein